MIVNLSEWAAKKEIEKLDDVRKGCHIIVLMVINQDCQFENHSHHQMKRYRWENVVVVMQEMTTVHDYIRNLQDLIRDQPSWSTT